MSKEKKIILKYWNELKEIRKPIIDYLKGAYKMGRWHNGKITPYLSIYKSNPRGKTWKHYFAMAVENLEYAKKEFNNYEYIEAYKFAKKALDAILVSSHLNFYSVMRKEKIGSDIELDKLSKVIDENIEEKLKEIFDIYFRTKRYLEKKEEYGKIKLIDEE